eukprot:259047_1
MKNSQLAGFFSSIKVEINKPESKSFAFRHNLLDIKLDSDFISFAIITCSDGYKKFLGSETQEELLLSSGFEITILMDVWLTRVSCLSNLHTISLKGGFKFKITRFPLKLQFSQVPLGECSCSIDRLR